MKLLVLAFFFLHVAFVTAGLFAGNDTKTSRSSLTGGRVQPPQNAGECGEHRGSEQPVRVCLCVCGGGMDGIQTQMILSSFHVLT